MTVTIADDDDAPMFSFTTSNDAPSETGEETSTLTVSLGSGSVFQNNQTISFELSGTATEKDDYEIDLLELILYSDATEVTATLTVFDDDDDDDDETVVIEVLHNGATVATGTVTIADDDVPMLSIAVNNDSIAEAGGTSTVTVSTGSTTFITEQTIDLTLGGTATNPDDYTISDTSLTLAAGQTSVTATVTAVQDTIDEPNETVLITASVGGSTIGTQQTITITDDDAAPTLTVSVAPTTLYEDARMATVTIATVGGVTVGADTTVNLTLTGTATKGTDYSIGSESLTLTSGQSSATTTITTITDTDAEGDETVQIAAATAAGTAVGSQQTVTIKDPPALTVSFSGDFERTNFHLVEGDSVDVPVVLSGAPGREVTITMDIRQRRTTSSSDYTAMPLSLTFGPAETRKTVTVTATDDNEVDLGESIAVNYPQLVDLPAGITGSGISVVIVLVDNDFEYQVSHAAGTTLAVDEDAGPLTATVRVQTPGTVGSADLAALNETVVLSVSTAADTATEGTDYTALSQTLTFGSTDFVEQSSSGCVPSSADCMRAEKTVSIPITDDMLYEGATPETFTLTLSHGTGQRVTYPSPGETATVSIADNERPALTFSVLPATILEDGGMATVTVATSDGNTITSDATIDLTLAGTATKGTDYIIDSESLTLMAGQSSVTATITATNDADADDNETVVVTATSGGNAVGSAQTVTIAETLPVLSVAVNNDSIAEAGGTSTVTVSTGSTTFSTDQTIGLALGGTATETWDYTLSEASLTLTAGETSVTATVTAVQDNYDDDAETVIVTATSGGDDIGAVTVTIADDDDAPMFSFTTSNDAPSETGEETSTLTVSLGSGSVFQNNQTISFELSGTATEKDDYEIDLLELILYSDATEVTATLTVFDDDDDDDDETVVIEVLHNGATVATGTVTIADDDVPMLSIAVNNDSIAEAGGTSTVTVSTGSTTFITEQTIDLTLGGTATNPDDYTISDTSLTLAAGQTSVTATVTAVQDTIDEPNETVLITASVGGSTIGTQQTITITDDDAAPTLTVSVAPTTLYEDARMATVTIATVGGVTVGADTTVNLTLTGTATKGTDYSIGSESLTLTSGQSSATTTITTITDTDAEGDETVQIAAATAAGTAVGSQQTVTIKDPPALTVSFSGDFERTNFHLVEGDSVDVPVVLSGAPGREVTITMDIRQRRTTSSSDYTAMPLSLTFGPAETRKTVTVTATDDNEVDLGESIAVNYPQLVDLPAGITGSGISVVIVLVDNDFEYQVSHAAGTTLAVDEDAGPLTATVRVQTPGVVGSAVLAALNETVVLSVSTAADTATEGTDYTALSQTLTFGSSDFVERDSGCVPSSGSCMRAEKTVSIPITDDMLYEGATPETFTLTLSHQTGQRVTYPSAGETATVSIADDDAAPTLSVAVNNASIAEAGGTSTVTVSTGGTTFTTEQTIDLTLGGTATNPDDYTISDTSLTLAAGQTSVTATVTAVQDTIDEPNETVLITASVGGGTIGTQQTITIADDDAAPTLSVAVNNPSIAEAGGTSTVTVSTGGTTFSTDQTIDLTLGGTATNPDDYIISDTSLTLPANATSVIATVTAVQDTIDEPNETVLITASVGGGTVGTQQTVTITDDDAAPTLSVAVNPGTIAEAGGTSTVTVSTGGTTFSTDQTIALTLAGTATKGTDYTIDSESLTLRAGESSVAATITATNDSVDDNDETVLITASHNSTTVGTQQTVTISETAVTLSVAVNNASIAEAGGTSTVTVSTGPSTFTTDQTIDLTLGGTATQTTDYILSDTSLTLTAGQTSVTATVTAVQDTIDEPDETAIVTARTGGNPIGAATVTITDDDDPPVLSVSVNNASIAEAAGASTVTVSVSGSVFESDQVFTLTLGGTATETGDYTLSDASLTLTAGQTSVTATVTAVQDNIDEPNETVIVTVSSGGNPIGAATVTITDDDAAPSLYVEGNNDRIAEAGGTSVVTVTASGSVYASDQIFYIAVGHLEVDGMRPEDNDYTLSDESITLTAGQTSVSVTVTAVQDTIDEPNEEVVVIDDDDPPVLSVSVNNASIAEAGGTSTVTVSTGTGSTFASAQTIALTLGGTATATDDFTIASTSLTLPAGVGTAASSATTVVTAVQDKIDDDGETVLIDASHNGNAVGTRQTVTITDDDDPPVPTFTVSSASIGEASGTSTITVSTGTGSTYATAQTIALTLGGTATETDDFTIASTSLTLAAGAGTAASSETTVVTAVQDRIDEAGETVLIDASRNGNAVGSQQTVTITDDDAPPVLSLEVSASTIDEGGGASTVTVSTGAGSTFETGQTIALTLGGTATETDDYTIGSKSLTLPAGVGTAASEIATPIMAVDDDFFEGTTNEQLTVTGSRNSVDFGAARTVTIAENEDAPKLTLTLSGDSITENGGSTAVAASVSPRTVDAFTVTFAVTPNAPATAVDYDLTGTLSFAALSASPTGTVTITANDNRVDRPDKTVSVTGTSSESYFRPTDAVTLTIEDEDAPPAPVLEVSDASIAENAGTSTVTVGTGTGSTFATDQAIELTLSGTATAASDYSLDTTLTLPAGVGVNASTVTATTTPHRCWCSPRSRRASPRTAGFPR